MSGIRTMFSLLDNDGSTPPPPPPGVFYSMTEYPFASPDLLNYGRGAEQWHSPCDDPTGCPSGSQVYDRVSNPATGSNNQWVENSPNRYMRTQWTELEGSTLGNYTFGDLAQFIEDGIDNKQMVSFGIMTYYDDPPDNQLTFYDGAISSYPQYVHNVMKAEGNSANRDFVTGAGQWCPNWNHFYYLERLRALHVALRSFLLSNSHAGVTYADAIYCIDIRGYGNYGEWHSGNICDWNDYPGNTQPTIATFKEIIDCHTEVFDQWPLVIMVAAYNAYDPNLPSSQTGSSIPLFHPYAEIAHYALDATNAWGRVGYRRDQVGATDDYLHKLLENNGAKFPTGVGLTVAQKFLALANVAPGTGEPLPGAFLHNQMADLENQIVLYKATSFGNGNYGNGGISSSANTSSAANRVRNAFKLCGYRLRITNGEAPVIITRTVPFDIKANWVNTGVGPCYEDWTVQYQLQTGGGTVVWTGNSSKVLKLFRPDQGTVLTTDTLTVPGSVSTGTYKLVVKVTDPKGFKNNLLLAMQPMNADRSYTMHASVSVI